MRISGPARACGLDRDERLDAAIEERRIDLPLQLVEHPVDEVDQPIGGGHRLVYVTVGDGVEDGEMAINARAQGFAAFKVRVVKPTDAPEDRVERPDGVLHEAL